MLRNTIPPSDGLWKPQIHHRHKSHNRGTVSRFRCCKALSLSSCSRTIMRSRVSPGAVIVAAVALLLPIRNIVFGDAASLSFWTFVTVRYPHVKISSRSGLMLSYSRQNSYQKSTNRPMEWQERQQVRGVPRQQRSPSSWVDMDLTT